MDLNDVFQKLFEGVIPERIDEIKNLAKEYSVQYRQIYDRDGFNIGGGPFGIIQYTIRSMHQMWLFAHAGKISLHCYATLIGLLKSDDRDFDMEKVKKIPGQKEVEDEFDSVINKIKEIREAASEKDFSWPEEIPTPEQGRQADDEQALVFDLACMAAAYIFLHELRHVIFSDEGNTPEDPIEEELACDAFAKDIMISQITKYSEQTGYPADKVKTKRLMAIALVLGFLLLTTAKSNLIDSSTHPSVHQRWLCTLKDLELQEDDYFYLYFASIILAIFQHLNIPIAAKKVESFRSFCLKLIEDLRDFIERTT